MKLPKNIYALADVVGIIARSTTRDYNSSTMQGACVCLSAAFELAVNKLGFGKADLCLYYRHRLHAWVELTHEERRFVVDLTFTQYEPDAPRVYAFDAHKKKEYTAYVEKISGEKYREARESIVRGPAAHVSARNAGSQVDKMYWIVDRMEGMFC